MTVEPLAGRHAHEAIALLGRLRVELLGIRSQRLHAALVADAVAGVIAGRVAEISGEVAGLVLAAPASYWWSLPAREWSVALECIVSRLRRGLRAGGASNGAGAPAAPASEVRTWLRNDVPPRTWQDPGEAWRIIFVGTAPEQRGRGVAAALYRSIMAERSLVAHVALENTASLRLHHATGWQLFPDAGVVLAVHVRDTSVRPEAERSKADTGLARRSAQPASHARRSEAEPR